MFRPYVRVIQSFCLPDGQCEDILYARRVRKVASRSLVWPNAALFFHFNADGLQIKTKFVEHGAANTLAKPDEAQQQVFATDEIMVEPVGFPSSQCQDLLCPGCEVVHRFLGRGCWSRSALC